jgi:hemerythrin
MDEIVWSSRLSTGVDKVDTQHRALIEKLRGLEEAIRSGETTAVLLDAFRFLETYMREHFRDEEAEMDRLRCPEAELNRKGHQRFLATFMALNARLASEGSSEALAQEVHHELAEWFVHHTLLVDVRMARSVEEKMAS